MSAVSGCHGPLVTDSSHDRFWPVNRQASRGTDLADAASESLRETPAATGGRQCNDCRRHGS